MKPDELIGAEVIEAQGIEGYGCKRCGIPAGSPEYEWIAFRLTDGRICRLMISGVCPPDMDTGRREQRMVGNIR